jgi:hypothetical protein
MGLRREPTHQETFQVPIRTGPPVAEREEGVLEEGSGGSRGRVVGEKEEE